MFIEPKRIEPGWATRWPKDALKLMSRAWILWIGVAAALGFISAIPRELGLFAIPAILFVFAQGLDFARLTDEKYVTGRDVVDSVMRTLRLVAHEVWSRRAFLFALVCLFGFIETTALLGWVPVDKTPEATVSSLIPWLFSYNSSLGNIAPLLWLSIGLQNGWVWPGLSFFLQQSFGELSPETTWSLANRAVVLNHWPWNCQMLVFTTVVFIGLGVPVVGWAVSVFMPALFYVGHRELFTGQTGNRKRAPRTVTESTMQTSAA